MTDPFARPSLDNLRKRAGDARDIWMWISMASNLAVGWFVLFFSRAPYLGLAIAAASVVMLVRAEVRLRRVMRVMWRQLDVTYRAQMRALDSEYAMLTRGEHS